MKVLTVEQARTPRPAREVLEIGQWRLDISLDELSLDHRRVKLEPRMTRVLCMLADHAGDMVSTEALLDHAWPNVTVTSGSLYQVVAQLRRILSDDEQTPAFIATIPRKGYRLIAPVRRLERTDAVSDLRARRHGPRSVAVLPFAAANLPESHDYLAEVLLDNLITEVSRYPLLTVIARGTMLTYRGRPIEPETLAADLGVRFVVEGRIISAGETLRIGARLTDTSNNTQIWSDDIDVLLSSCLTAGQDGMGRFARDIQFRIADGAAHQDAAEHGRDSPADQIALRAWVELYCRPQSPDTNTRAWRWAQEAIDRSASSAIAWNALAYCEWRAAQYGWSSIRRDDLLARALLHAQRAIELSPRDPDPHYTQALITHHLNEPLRAEAALRHCLALNPSYAPAHGLLGIVRTMLGFPGEASLHCGRAFALSPYEPLRAIWHWAEAWAALVEGDNAAALAHSQRGMAANPDFPSCYLTAGVAAYRLGQTDLAERCITFLRQGSAFPSIEAVWTKLPAFRIGPGPGILTDLQAAGLPAGPDSSSAP